MQYNTCKSDFEISFDQHAEIHLDDDDGGIQRQNYEFIKISDLESVEANKNVDLLAVVKTVGEPTNLISKKTGQELTKCDLTIVDDSGVDVNLTVWGTRASKAPMEFANTPIVAFRRTRVSDYGGKSLSGGDFDVNPDIPQAQQLAAWWQSLASSGQTAASRSLSTPMGGGGGRMPLFAECKDIVAIKNENLGHNGSDKPDWISFKATIAFLKKDKEGGAWYPACPNAGEPCKNRFKVTQTTDGQWYCDKCQGSFPNCVRRWIFSGVIEDDSCSTWVSFFNEQAETLLGGAKADDVYNQTQAENQDQDAYESYFARANFSEWSFKCKVKNEMVNEESRVKTSVYSLHPVDYVQESKELLSAIEKF
jgi:replication factor A1